MQLTLSECRLGTDVVIFLVVSCVLMHVFSLMLQVVNAFSLQSDAEIKAKVITRLCNMTDLHQLLNKSLASNDFVFVSRVFDTAHCLQLSSCS